MGEKKQMDKGRGEWKEKKNIDKRIDSIDKEREE